MKRAVCISPHPDDESLGCGGTLLRLKSRGVEIFWVIVTSLSGDSNSNKKAAKLQEKEIESVAEAYEFTDTIKLDLPAFELDQLPFTTLIDRIGDGLDVAAADTVFVPFEHDIHTDHKLVYQATISATKTFRRPHTKRIYSYETLSESNFAVEPGQYASFQPNFFVDISEQLQKKIEILNLYKDIVGEHPYPRSEESIRALATLRGSQAGVEAAEGLILLKEIF